MYPFLFSFFKCELLVLLFHICPDQKVDLEEDHAARKAEKKKERGTNRQLLLQEEEELKGEVSNKANQVVISFSCFRYILLKRITSVGRH